MRRFKILLTVCLLLVVVSAVDAQTTRLKIATMAPDGSFWMKEYKQAADEIESRTAGRVSIRFYPGGTMGGDSAVIRKIRIGQLHGGVFLVGSMAGIDPDLEIYNLPLMFRNHEEVDYVRARMDEKLIKSLEENGYISFGISETGFTYLMSTEPTRTLDELRGRKAWMPQGDPLSLAIVEAAGLSPVPLPLSDVLTGLQTGLIDTVAAPPVGALALQWFTKATYFTDLPITYVCGTMAIGAKAFAKLSPGDQSIVREVFGEANSALDKRSRSDNQGARDALAKQGVEIIEPTQAARAKWNEIAAEATANLIAERGYDPDLLSEARSLLESYRAEHPADPSGS